MTSFDLLNHALALNNIVLPTDQIEKLVRFTELINAWNRVFNLTTITKPEEMVYLHLIDSIVVRPYLHGKRCLDVGTGAGLPGIPLAIVNPHRQWVLLDKNSKKTRFLIQTIAELNLTNVEVIHHRSEDFHPVECFDSIVSRALGTISMFVKTTEHLLCREGRFIALKGKYPQDELNNLPKDFQSKIIRLDIKGMAIERHLVCIERNH